MKKVVLLLALYSISAFLQSVESKDTIKSNFEKAMIIKDKETEKIDVQVRVPDTSSLLPRKDTKQKDMLKTYTFSKLIKSNKLLY